MHNIFLDDVRNAPEYGRYNTVRSYSVCISLLQVFGQALEKISLDYDLGDMNETGYDVLVYMKENGINPQYINIHSDHPKGAKEMVRYANKHFKNSIVSHRKMD